VTTRTLSPYGVTAPSVRARRLTVAHMACRVMKYRLPLSVAHVATGAPCDPSASTCLSFDSAPGSFA